MSVRIFEKVHNNIAILKPKLSFILTLKILLLVILSNVETEARYRRCFTCRSRGPLGDCKDPFYLNATTFDGSVNTKASIEATPCASGWCAKIIENDLGDSIAATERLCMTRPPTDNEERCSETFFEHHRDRKVFLCMCFGDLCNIASTMKPSKSTQIITIAIFNLMAYLTTTRLLLYVEGTNKDLV